MITEFIKITNPSEQREDIERAAEYLKNGEVAAIPTETVYGLAANAFDPDAVKKIFAAKGRPQDNPLIVHIAHVSELYSVAREVPEKALKLAERFMPGPLTVILPKKDIIPDEVSAGLDTVAVRMPSHPAANAIIKAAGVPLAAPSANISGFPSPTSVQHVADDMNGRIVCIVDGGDCEFGIESTVLTLATPVPRLLRPGAVTHEQLEEVIGKVDIDPAVLNPLAKGAVAASPGMKYKHYSPKAEISIVRGSFEEYLAYINAHKGEADYALCFEGEENIIPLPCVTMGRENEPLTQTHRLFDALRELDALGAKKVFARSPSEKGVGLGVCNRLYRAAGFHFLNEKGKIIGICGGSGSGKSTFCAALEKNGAVIIDADKAAREITVKGSPVLKKLSEVFGEDILDENGELKRRELASRAFSSEENTRILTEITNPAIIDLCRERAEKAAAEGKNVIIDAPLLFSSGLNAICDKTVFITAPDSVRIKRIMKRDGISEAEAEKRLSAQKNEMKLNENADVIIENGENKNVEELIRNSN